MATDKACVKGQSGIRYRVCVTIEPQPEPGTRSGPADVWSLERLPREGGLANTFVANGLILTSGALTGIIAARLLGPEGRGLLAAILFWPQLLAGVCFLSLNDAAAYEVSREPEREREITAAAIFLSLLLIPWCVGLGWVALPLLLGEAREQAWSLARWFLGLATPFQFVALAANARDLGAHRLKRYNAYRVAPGIVYLGGLTILAVAHQSYVPVVLATNLLATVLVAVARLSTTRLAPRPTGALSAVRPLLVRGIAFHGLTLLLIASSQVDRLLAVAHFGDRLLGFYMVAFALAYASVGSVTSTFSTVLFPRLAAAGKQSKRKGSEELASGIRATTFVLFPTTLVVVLSAHAVVPLLYGSAFAPAGTIAAYLTIALSLTGTREVLARSLRALGETRTATAGEFLALAGLAGLGWPLAHTRGADGLILAIMLANALALGYLVCAVWARQLIRPCELWGIRLSSVRDVRRLL